MNKVLKKLTAYYYIIYVAAIIVATIGFHFFRKGISIDAQSSIGIALSSFLIILIIGSIPLTLSIFSKKTKQWAKLENVKERLERYEKGSIVRLIIIGAGFLMGVFFYFLLKSPSMLFSSGIAAIALFFCKPAEVKIISELQLEDPDNID